MGSGLGGAFCGSTLDDIGSSLQLALLLAREPIDISRIAEYQNHMIHNIHT